MRRQSEALASRLPPLQVRAERIAATVVQGMHGRRRAWQGESFWQFRRYQQFDEARHIDWRRSARGRDLFVRENEWEAAQSVWIWRDSSPSMSYRSRRDVPEKSETADVLAAALAILLTEGGENVGLLGEGMPARGGRTGLNIFMEAMAVSAGGTSAPPPEPLPRHAAVILIADFLEPIQSYRDAISALAARGCMGHCVQILDPAEEAFPFSGRIRFEGTEDEGPHLLRRADRVRSEYQEKLALHREELKDLATTFGWSFSIHTTDRPSEAAKVFMTATA
ncbi:MAG: DUF58 domain-containing protein, partial [Alphaproteobacteria bacterium]|nr:DUF58 domain-containing protein [Alphaproteobacteria bacterium]